MTRNKLSRSGALASDQTTMTGENVWLTGSPMSDCLVGFAIGCLAILAILGML